MMLARIKTVFFCSAEPPTLSMKVIRNLGESFCKIPVASISDEKLLKKSNVKKPVGASSSKKTGKNLKNDSKNDDLDNNDKSCKKSKKK